MKKIKILNQFSYQSFPLADEDITIEVEEDILKEIGKTKCFDVENNTIIDYDNTEEVLERLRFKRKPLLIAFDKWEKAVIRGREEDSAKIMSWYYDLLDLKENAFTNIPERIKYYM